MTYIKLFRVLKDLGVELFVRERSTFFPSSCYEGNKTLELLDPCVLRGKNGKENQKVVRNPQDLQGSLIVNITPAQTMHQKKTRSKKKPSKWIYHDFPIPFQKINFDFPSKKNKKKGVPLFFVTLLLDG